MKIPKTAKREESRLETLIAYRILDTPQEQEFDIITEISVEPSIRQFQPFHL